MDSTLNTTTYGSVIDQMLEDLQTKVAQYVPESLHAGAVASRLITYRDVIAPNFVPWMAQVWVRCWSNIARVACQENLRCEVAEDHPGMLRRYATEVDSHRIRQQIQSLECLTSKVGLLTPHINFITAVVQRSAIDGLLVMAGLEKASIVFIPRMRKWGEDLGFRDFEYVDKHGIADIEHANDLRNAVEAEANEEGIEPNVLTESPALTAVNTLLYRIFV